MARKKQPIVRAREDMEKLGVYKPEFEPLIELYGQLLEQYTALMKEHAKSGYRCWEFTESGTKKAPIVTTLESLRKDILAYAAQLGLTPQGLLKTDDAAFAKKKTNALAAAFQAMKDDSV